MTPGRALERVLDTISAEAPEAVQRGRFALVEALGWTKTTTWPVVRQFSGLAEGAPFELIWRPGRPGLYWTAEPAASELARDRRIERSVELVETIGGRLDAPTRQLALATANASSANWPVWVAGRHTKRSDAAKLYVLVNAVPPAFEAVTPLLRGADQPTMIGLTPQGEREFYWTRPTRDAGDLRQLRADRATAPLAEMLNAALIDWTGSGFEDKAGGRLRLSLRYGVSGQPETLAAFVRVDAAGGGPRVRIRLLARGGNDNPALARCWADGQLRPMLLSLAASTDGLNLALGLRDNGSLTPPDVRV
ncbi:hypothetical protein KX816_05595 [Sphingosinicellaceae bacterium]|nr:hypothetical protein KX816_05595 [Sphingosinicellaceae bacterium]